MQGNGENSDQPEDRLMGLMITGAAVGERRILG